MQMREHAVAQAAGGAAPSDGMGLEVAIPDAADTASLLTNGLVCIRQLYTC